ncbi:MAG TPA: hypothetical protein VMZ52_01765 [Bryobacteraceae bacterium]|nr:hypothetical protein [Bryobacteraceae bacterium]
MKKLSIGLLGLVFAFGLQADDKTKVKVKTSDGSYKEDTTVKTNKDGSIDKADSKVVTRDATGKHKSKTKVRTPGGSYKEKTSVKDDDTGSYKERVKVKSDGEVQTKTKSKP